MLFRSSWIILESEPILITSRLIGLLNVADKAALKLKGGIWLFWLFNAYPAELLVLNCAANGWFYCPVLPADSGLMLNMEVVGTENDGWQRCQISRAGAADQSKAADWRRSASIWEIKSVHNHIWQQAKLTKHQNWGLPNHPKKQNTNLISLIDICKTKKINRKG